MTLVAARRRDLKKAIQDHVQAQIKLSKEATKENNIAVLASYEKIKSKISDLERAVRQSKPD